MTRSNSTALTPSLRSELDVLLAETRHVAILEALEAWRTTPLKPREGVLVLERMASQGLQPQSFDWPELDYPATLAEVCGVEPLPPQPSPSAAASRHPTHQRRPPLSSSAGVAEAAAACAAAVGHELTPRHRAAGIAAGDAVSFGADSSTPTGASAAPAAQRSRPRPLNWAGDSTVGSSAAVSASRATPPPPTFGQDLWAASPVSSPRGPSVPAHAVPAWTQGGAAQDSTPGLRPRRGESGLEGSQEKQQSSFPQFAASSAPVRSSRPLPAPSALPHAPSSPPPWMAAAASAAGAVER